MAGTLCRNCGKREASHRPDGTAADCYPGYEPKDEEGSGVPLSPEGDGGGEPTTPTPQGAEVAPRRTRTRKPRLMPGPIKLPAHDAKRVKIILASTFKGGSEAAHYLSVQTRKDFWTEADKLQSDETAYLVEGVYSVLETFPKALLWLAEVSAQGVWVQLGIVLAMVSAPRLARHGIIPEEVAAIISIAPLLMASGGAPNSDRGNGNGEIHTASVDHSETPVPGSVPFQTGRGGVADAADYPLGTPPV